jgi:hypothetical protein
MRGQRNIFIFQIFLTISQQVDYCAIQKATCQGFPHIACNNSGLWADKCPKFAQIVELSIAHKTLIVAMHNALRNRIASGDEPGFSAAVRMATMVIQDLSIYYFSLKVR